MDFDLEKTKKEIDTLPWDDEKADTEKAREIIFKYGHDKLTGKWIPLIEELELAKDMYGTNKIKFSQGWFEILKYFQKKYGDKWIVYSTKLYRKIMKQGGCI